MAIYKQGTFRPTNPQKYDGNVANIVYRSSWELRAFQFCDMNDNVLRWNSEETVIGYLSPLDNRYHRYFVDLTIVVGTPEGGFRKFLVEIKPYAETIKPRKGKSEKTFLHRVKKYLVNMAKWEAARAFCKKNGYEFVVWTEKELFGK